jgi:hypothetical protein
MPFSKNMILTAWLVIFTILGSSVGLSIYKHVCSSSGIVEMGVGNEDHCCSSTIPVHFNNNCESETGAIQIESSCCEFQVKHLNLPVVSTMKLNIDLKPVILTSLIPLELFDVQVEKQIKNYQLFDHGPPLLNPYLKMIFF